MIHLLPVLLVSWIDGVLAVLLFYASYRVWGAWRLTREREVLAAALGMCLVASGLVVEAAVTGFFVASWKGGAGVPWALTGLFAGYPFAVLYVAGYAVLLYGYGRRGGAPLVILYSAAGWAWAGLQVLSAALSGLVAYLAYRRGAARLFALGFAFISVSHLVGVMPSPRFLLLSAAARAVGFAAVVYGLGVLGGEEA